MKFTDHKGRDWNCAITVATVKRVNDATQINLCNAVDGKLMIDLGNDTLKFIEVLYHVLKPQAVAMNVSDDELADALWGDTLAGAYEAFCEGLVNFFQRPEQREVLGRLRKKMKDTQAKAGALALELIESDMTKTRIDKDLTAAKKEAELILGS